MKFLWLIPCLLQAALGISWISEGSLPDGTIIPTCPGQDVSIPWNFSVAASEHLINVDWHFTPENGTEKLLATQVVGNFIVAPDASLQVDFLPNAGLLLHAVGKDHAGTYAVHVNLNVNGAASVLVQSVKVQVSDMPLTTDGQLHISMRGEAALDNATSQYHAQLTCGQFLPLWESKLSVLWKTPDGQTVPSTSSDQGQFRLSLPNPILGGEYSCLVDTSSAGALCISSDSPLMRGATMSVDGVQAQLVVMATQITATQQENAQLRQMIESVQSNQDQNIRTELETLKQDGSQLRQQVQSLQQENSQLNTKINTAGMSVSFQAWRNGTKDSVFVGGFYPYRSEPHSHRAGEQVNFTRILSNIGGAYDNTSSTFTAPVDGTYAFFVSVGTNGGVGVAVEGEGVVTSVFAENPGGERDPTQGSCHVVLDLSQGQSVWVQSVLNETKVWSYTAPFTRPELGGVNYMDLSFSGALLHAHLQP